MTDDTARWRRRPELVARVARPDLHFTENGRAALSDNSGSNPADQISGGNGPVDPPTASPSGRMWRSLWRTHFYAGFVAAPFLVMLALTGLVILYTGPIEQLTEGNLRTVEPVGDAVSLDDQRALVLDEHPGATVAAVTPPSERAAATAFAVTTSAGASLMVFVDPYRARVLGSTEDGGGITGLANRLHGDLNLGGASVPMPSLGGMLGEGPAFEPAPIGNVVLEVVAGWAMVLAITGVYLWMPRKAGTGRALLRPRWSKGGRARWRDLHATAGTLLGALLIFFLVTGLPWSSVWGSNFAYVASRVTPNEATSFWEWEGPTSGVPSAGDVDRAGNAIPWSAAPDVVPPSGGGSGHEGHGAHHGSGAAPDVAPAEMASLDLVAASAEEEGMEPGYSIHLPVDAVAADGTTTFGSFVVFNPWPTRMSDQGALYLDQFSATTLARSTPETWGRIQWATDFGVQTHMGTQLGLFSRVAATAVCLLVLWNVATALAMWNRRRRRGTVGLPRRPVDVRLQRAVGVSALVLAVVYPLWGLSLVAVLAFDRFVVRRVPALRAAFGMR